MSDNTTNRQKAFVFYLSGVSMSEIGELAAVAELAKRGILVELEAAPITGPQTLSYQAFSGRLPASFGFFDTLMPLCHLPRAQEGSDGYTIVEDLSGRDVPPRALPDILRTVGWTVEYEEVALTDIATRVQALAATQPTTDSCKIVRCTVHAGDRSQFDLVGQALRQAQAWAGESGLLALLSDSRPAPVTRFVNVNNFLADMGILERDEESGSINWANSLAYYAGHGQLWINLLGRDPQGAVHPQDEYEEVCDTLIKALPLKIRDAETGAPVIERIYRKEEIYSGEYLFCAPDLVVLFKPGYAPSPQSAHAGFDEATVLPAPANTITTAGVDPSAIKGFLLASGPALLAGTTLTESAALSAALPSLLHALGVDYSDVDSTAISGLFSPTYLETHPIRTSIRSQELSDEDEELVINRLRDLGYV